jgi:uncharacterized protein YkwD
MKLARFAASALCTICIGCPVVALVAYAADDALYASINRLRADDGTCSVAGTLPAMTPQAALERVAGELARGAQLSPAMTAAGYRANRSTAVTVSGEGAGVHAAEQLASHYCRELRNAAMTDVGIYRDSRQVWVVMAAPFAPVVGMSGPAAAQRVLDLVNEARRHPRRCGKQAFGAAGPLQWNEMLANASLLHSQDMAHNNYFSHSGLDGSTPAQRVQRAGYRYSFVGENLAAGQMKPEEAVLGWINSPTHCTNLMNPLFTEMGAAYAVDASSRLGVYWTQEFGARR